MLVWEDEIESAEIAKGPGPGIANAVATHLRQSRVARSSPALAAVMADVDISSMPKASVTAVTTTATVTPPAARRVNAADKRIINGRTDVNQLVPFKYKWAW